MEFVLNEFAIVMFLSFVLVLIAGFLMASGFWRFLIIQEIDFTKKLGPRPKSLDMIGSYGFIDETQEILKERPNKL